MLRLTMLSLKDDEGRMLADTLFYVKFLSDVQFECGENKCLLLVAFVVARRTARRDRSCRCRS
jgi:hypothetical protein